MPAGQLDLFAPAPALPAGFRHWGEAVPREEERALLEAFTALDFAAFAFHGHLGRRRVVSFGRAYDFEREALRDAKAAEVKKAQKKAKKAAKKEKQQD